MNDLEEMRFGMLEGRRLFDESEGVRKFAGSRERVDNMKQAFAFYFNQLAMNGCWPDVPASFHIPR
jgi:hypothetical protein